MNRDAKLIYVISTGAVMVSCVMGFLCFAFIFAANPDSDIAKTQIVRMTMMGQSNGTMTLPDPAVKIVITATPGVRYPAAAAPKATATKPVGLSRDHPVPAGSTATVDKMTIHIANTVRPADAIVAAGNMFNTKPEAGMEYLMVEVSLSCEKPSNEKCSLFALSFSAVGSSGVVRKNEIFVSGVQGELETGEFFGGAKKAGKLFYFVGKGESDVILIYKPFLGSDAYFLLP